MFTDAAIKRLQPRSVPYRTFEGQGHALQDVGSRHYDRHSYLEEKRTALDQWEHCLRMKLAGDNVMSIRRA